MPRNRTFGETALPRTAAEVSHQRNLEDRATPAQVRQTIMENAETAQPNPIENPASERQINFLHTLLTERDLFTGKLAEVNQADREATLENIKASVPTLSKKAASKWIEKLLECPKLETATSSPINLPNVPAGRYALTGNDGTTDFYKVDRPTEGRWAGKTFVKLLVGPEEQRVSFAQTKTILDRIVEAGVQDAMLRYGIEIGECGHCGRRLTNEESREIGIGPICRQNMGW